MAKRRDWRSYERNWRAYERFRRDDVELFLKRAKELVWSMEPPWSVKHTGRRGYPPRSMALLCLLKTELKMDYRSISSYLKANPDQLKLVGLDRAPSHTAIRNALSRIPESYLKRLNDRLVEPFKKGIWEQIAQGSPQRGMKPGSA